MIVNENDIVSFYENSCEANRLSKQRVNSIEFLTTMKYLKELCHNGAKILDACAGCGVYSFPLAELGYKITAGDLVEFNVNQMIIKQNENPILEDIYAGSIIDLSQFDDNSFDVVLNFGGYYHMTNQKDREKSIKESIRVLRNGGLFFVAYLNKYSNFIKYNHQWSDDFHYFEEYLERGYTENEKLFYANSPEDIEEVMSQYNIGKIHNIATDGLKFAIRDSINALSDDEFERYMKMHYEMCQIKSLLGYSEHALYIGEKLNKL